MRDISSIPEADPEANLHPRPDTTPDGDFTRHKQALASQVTMTGADILKPATATLSHW